MCGIVGYIGDKQAAPNSLGLLLVFKKKSVIVPILLLPFIIEIIQYIWII